MRLPCGTGPDAEPHRSRTGDLSLVQAPEVRGFDGILRGPALRSAETPFITSRYRVHYLLQGTVVAKSCCFVYSLRLNNICHGHLLEQENHGI